MGNLKELKPFSFPVFLWVFFFSFLMQLFLSSFPNTLNKWVGEHSFPLQKIAQLCMHRVECRIYVYFRVGFGLFGWFF